MNGATTWTEDSKTKQSADYTKRILKIYSRRKKLISYNFARFVADFNDTHFFCMVELTKRNVLMWLLFDVLISLLTVLQLSFSVWLFFSFFAFVVVSLLFSSFSRHFFSHIMKITFETRLNVTFGVLKKLMYNVTITFSMFFFLCCFSLQKPHRNKIQFICHFSVLVGTLIWLGPGTELLNCDFFGGLLAMTMTMMFENAVLTQLSFALDSHQHLYTITKHTYCRIFSAA